ncbi:hypothetical protein [Arthrobacter sp. TMN-50]
MTYQPVQGTGQPVSNSGARGQLGLGSIPEEPKVIHLITYRYLRWLLILLPVVLFVVTAAVALQQNHLEASISAYYGGWVRDVFVGTLIAIAVCLVAYQGVGLIEDHALNGAGFYAIFVALIPTDFPGLMEKLRSAETPDGLAPSADEYVFFLRVAFACVLMSVVVVAAIGLKAGDFHELSRPNVDPPWLRTLTGSFLVATVMVLVAFLALAAQQLYFPAGDVTMAGLTHLGIPLAIHDLAAIFLIASLFVAVITNTWPFFRFDALRESARLGYLIIAVLMSVGILIPVLAAWLFAPGRTVIFIEWWEIGLFATFWFLETDRRRRLVRRQKRGKIVKTDEDSRLLSEPTRVAGS